MFVFVFSGHVVIVKAFAKSSTLLCQFLCVGDFDAHNIISIKVAVPIALFAFEIFWMFGAPFIGFLKSIKLHTACVEEGTSPFGVPESIVGGCSVHDVIITTSA